MQPHLDGHAIMVLELRLALRHRIVALAARVPCECTIQPQIQASNFVSSPMRRRSSAPSRAAAAPSPCSAADTTAVAVATFSATSTARTRSSWTRTRCSTRTERPRARATTAGRRTGNGSTRARAGAPRPARAATRPFRPHRQGSQSRRVFNFPSREAPPWRRRHPSRSAVMWAACPGTGIGARSKRRTLPILFANGRRLNYPFASWPRSCTDNGQPGTRHPPIPARAIGKPPFSPLRLHLHTCRTAASRSALCASSPPTIYPPCTILPFALRAIHPIARAAVRAQRQGLPPLEPPLTNCCVLALLL